MKNIKDIFNAAIFYTLIIEFFICAFASFYFLGLAAIDFYFGFDSFDDNLGYLTISFLLVHWLKHWIDEYE